MRVRVAAAAAIAALALLTGCGSGDGDNAADDGGKAKSPAKAEEKSGGEKTHKVTLKISGKGKSLIMFGAGVDNDTQSRTVQLPWSGTFDVTPSGMEKREGAALYIQPGNPMEGNRMMPPPGCTIEVDGKVVDDNDGGKRGRECEYALKG